MEEEIRNEIIGKAGFPLYVDYWKKYFFKMTGDQVKEVLNIVFHFNQTYEVLETKDLAVDMVISTIIDNIKRDALKRIRQSKASRKNGAMGGRPPKEEGKTEANCKQTVSKAEGNKDKDVNVDKDVKSKLESQFESFWNLYNKKLSKPDAEKKFKAALKKETFDNIIAGLNRYVKTRGDDSKYWKNPSTWLHNECWNDEHQATKTQSKHNNFEDQDYYAGTEGFEVC